MLITCKCLNVTIKSRGTELQEVNVDELELTATERAIPFFQGNIATVSELEEISKEQSGLVEMRKMGTWVIHRCYNCSLYTHALHKDLGVTLVLINKDLVTSIEEINRLKSSSDYSSIFRIVIDNSLIDDFDYTQEPTKFSVSQLSSTVQVALTKLQQQLETAVRQQVVSIEEKIRAYTTEQYQILEQFRERAHHEHRILTKLICSGEDINRVTNDMDTPPITPDSFKEAVNTTVSNTIGNRSTVVKDNVNDERPASDRKLADIYPNGNISKEDVQYMSNREPRSFDSETLFMLEGMDDAIHNEPHQLLEEEYETDDSGHDERVHMSRRHHSGHPTLAKSLPVSVPTFPSFNRRAIHDQDDDQLSRDPLDPHNIRASIKALAKSVHGDAVFGDLPRPRFSTQI